MLNLESALLISCAFEQKPQKDPQRFYNLSLEGYAPVEKETEDGFQYSAMLTFNLMKGVRHPLMKFKCSFLLTYNGKKEDRAKLKEHIVVAHAIPYLREFVSNVTMRSGIPPLMIAPVNAPRLWQDYSKDSKK